MRCRSCDSNRFGDQRPSQSTGVETFSGGNSDFSFRKPVPSHVMPERAAAGDHQKKTAAGKFRSPRPANVNQNPRDPCQSCGNKKKQPVNVQESICHNANRKADRRRDHRLISKPAVDLVFLPCNHREIVSISIAFSLPVKRARHGCKTGG